jgi:hypothetical protein
VATPKKERVKKQIEFDEDEGSDPPLQRKRSKSAPTPMHTASNQGELDLLKTEVMELKAELVEVRADRDRLLKDFGPVQLALGEAKGELKGIKEGLLMRKDITDK